jgi:hypothetical protein
MASSSDEIPLSRKMNGSNGGRWSHTTSHIKHTIKSRFITHTFKQTLPLLTTHISGADSLNCPLVRPPVSAVRISKSVDNEMDKANPSNGHVQPGISIRYGPMEDHDHHMPDMNGVDMNGSTSKRKSRGSLVKPSYADAESSDEDDQPLVRPSLSIRWIQPSSLSPHQDFH